MELYFLPIGVYGKSGMFEWLWKCTKSSDSVRDHSLSESKVLGLSLTCYKWFLDIGTTTIESVPHPYIPWGLSLRSPKRSKVRHLYINKVTYPSLRGFLQQIWERMEVIVKGILSDHWS